MLSQIGDGWQLIGPSVAPGQTQGQVASTTLQCDLDMVSQCLGLFNADPTALAEAVTEAREAHITLKHSKCLEQVGFNGVQSPCEWANQGGVRPQSPPWDK
jgi:hypothetical protein